ncbi:hypothetical protein CAQU_08760 [Corynebacterium aquilae DSM 44791]|uniref:Uncharacterized protein n=2 Tax=Corynebacterium aquilae TaxID=203263 RepID=A0A1L7CH16_9CORY|nr:hypothetical protein CAQU_08760 [Corynebacterium aquilae DSM 44791]
MDSYPARFSDVCQKILVYRVRGSYNDIVDTCNAVAEAYQHTKDPEALELLAWTALQELKALDALATTDAMRRQVLHRSEELLTRFESVPLSEYPDLYARVTYLMLLRAELLAQVGQLDDAHAELAAMWQHASTSPGDRARAVAYEAKLALAEDCAAVGDVRTALDHTSALIALASGESSQENRLWLARAQGRAVDFTLALVDPATPDGCFKIIRACNRLIDAHVGSIVPETELMLARALRHRADAADNWARTTDDMAARQRFAKLAGQTRLTLWDTFHTSADPAVFREAADAMNDYLAHLPAGDDKRVYAQAALSSATRLAHSDDVTHAAALLMLHNHLADALIGVGNLPEARDQLIHAVSDTSSNDLAITLRCLWVLAKVADISADMGDCDGTATAFNRIRSSMAGDDELAQSTSARRAITHAWTARLRCWEATQIKGSDQLLPMGEQAMNGPIPALEMTEQLEEQSRLVWGFAKAAVASQASGAEAARADACRWMFYLGGELAGACCFKEAIDCFAFVITEARKSPNIAMRALVVKSLQQLGFVEFLVSGSRERACMRYGQGIGFLKDSTVPAEIKLMHLLAERANSYSLGHADPAPVDYP